MHSMLTILCTGLVFFGLTIPSRTDDLSDARAAIAAGNKQWIEAWGKADADLLASIFAPDGAMLQRGGEPLRGRDAIRVAMAETYKQNGPALSTVDTTDVWLIDDRAYETGNYTYTFGSGEKAVKVGGRYMTIWRKQPDGGWKIIADLGFPDRK